MNFTNSIWAVNVAGECVLLALLLWRREHVRFPYFVAFIAFCVVRSFILLALRPPDSAPYALASWMFAYLRIVFILAVLVDLLYWVVKPYLMLSARKSTALLTAFAVVSGFSLYIGITNPAQDGWLESAVLTADRSVTLALAGAVMLLVLTPRMRRQWTRHERGVVLGFLYLVPQAAQFALRYYVTFSTAALLDLFKMLSFTVALAVWLAHFIKREGTVSFVAGLRESFDGEMTRKQ